MTSRFGKAFISSSLQLGLFFALALWASWPLASQFQTALPTGTSPTGTVPMLNAWILWWNAETLSHGLGGYWDAPIFFPSKGALALNEPQPSLLLLAPVQHIWDSPVPAYNLYLLVTLTLNGWLALRLLKQLGARSAIAVAGGVAMLLHPLLWRNVEAIQLTVLWPIVASISASVSLLRTERGDTSDAADSRSGRYRAGVWLGTCFAMAGWTCLYWFLFTLMTLGSSLCLMLIARRSRHRAVGLAIALGLCAVLMLPIYLPMQHFASEHELKRSPELVQALSATPVDWIATSGISIWTPAAKDNDLALSPGLGRTLLCLAGFVVFCSLRQAYTRVQRLAAILLTSMLTLSVLFSFGSNIEVGSWNLWEFLGSILGVIRSIRSPFRFAYLAQLATILLAAISAESLVQLAEKMLERFSATRRTVTSICATVALAVVITFDTVPERTQLCFPPSAMHQEPWRTYIASNVPHGTAILCLPVSANNTEASLERETRWMMHATDHGVPIANGYSGFTPRDWRELRSVLRDGDYSQDLLGTLASNRIKHLVIRTDLLPQDHLERLHSLSGTQVGYEDERYQILEIAPLSHSN